MQILKNKKVFIGMILITLLISLSVLSAENPDNTTTSQVSTQTNNDNTDHEIISTNTKEEQKNDNIDLNSKSKTKTEKEYRPDMAWIYEIDPTFPDPDVGQFDIKDDEEYIYENDSSKEVKNTETKNKIYTVSNDTQLVETLNDIVANQSEEYNYTINLDNGSYTSSIKYNINTKKSLNITLQGSSSQTQLYRGFFIISPSIRLTLSNLEISYSIIRNQGTCILNNIKLAVCNSDGGKNNSLYNNGTMSIRNSNLKMIIDAFEVRYSDDGEDDFYIYAKGGLYNEGILEIENTTFNNSYTYEITRYRVINSYYEDFMNYETYHTSGECNCKGGSIYNNGTIIINNTRFINNMANACSYPSDAYGGAIYNIGNMSINNSIFRNNTVGSYGEGYGGAIYNIGNLNITKTVFSEMKINNSHKPKGLIIYNNGTLNVTNSVLSSKNNETIPLIYSENQNVTVENNWWGSNNPEWTRLLKNVETPENWVYLRVQVSKDNLISTEKMEITYDFNWLTNGNKTVQAQENMPDNTIISGKSERGEISENTTRKWKYTNNIHSRKTGN